MSRTISQTLAANINRVSKAYGVTWKAATHTDNAPVVCDAFEAAMNAMRSRGFRQWELIQRACFAEVQRVERTGLAGNYDEIAALSIDEIQPHGYAEDFDTTGPANPIPSNAYASTFG